MYQCSDYCLIAISSPIYPSFGENSDHTFPFSDIFIIRKSNFLCRFIDFIILTKDQINHRFWIFKGGRSAQVEIFAVENCALVISMYPLLVFGTSISPLSSPTERSQSLNAFSALFIAP